MFLAIALSLILGYIKKIMWNLEKGETSFLGFHLRPITGGAHYALSCLLFIDLSGFYGLYPLSSQVLLFIPILQIISLPKIPKMQYSLCL